MKQRPVNLRRAFTLLELMVAMAIVAIIAGGLYTALRTSFSAQRHSEAAIDTSRTASLAMELLRTDFQNALQPGIELASGFADQNTTGNDLVFNTIAESPTHQNGDGEIKQIELVVENGPNGDQMLIRRVTSNLLAQAAVTPDDETICRGVAGFTLEYYNGSSWLTSWDSSQEDNTIPAAVRVTLDLKRSTDFGTGTVRFVRIFPLPCSTAAQDSAVNTGEALP